MSPVRPPRVARWLVSLILAPADRDHALGDLEEEHAQIAATRGAGHARRWYWSQVWRALGPSIRRRAARSGALPALPLWELRQAVRALRRRPGLVAASVATLALGIGAATAIFSVAEAVILRPLPYAHGERLVQIWNTYDSWRGHEVLDAFWDHIALSYPEYIDLREAQSSYDDVAIYGGWPMPLTGLGDPREAVVGMASTSLFPLLGVEPILGRTFAAGEEGPDAPRLAVLSFRTWRDDFGRDPAVLGRTLTLRGMPFTVIGVLPSGVELEPIARPLEEGYVAWVPIGALGESLQRGSHSYEALGRLTTGTDIVSAHAETAAILRGESTPDQRGARLTPRKVEEAGGATEPLLILLAGVGLLLLIACGNFATLLIGDASRRHYELATRYALGAETPTILRQLGLESLLLGLGGGVLGLLVAQWGTGFFLALAPSGLRLPEATGVNGTVLAFGVGLGVLTGAVFGLAPGLSVRRRDLGDQLRGGSRGVALGRSRVQRSVLAAQIALSLVLLVAGGLLLRTTRLLEAVDPGFRATELWTARVLFSSATHDEVEARQGYHALLERLRATPGIEAATLVSAMPFSGLGGSSSFDIVGREVAPSEKKPEALRRTVFPDYHEVLDVPLLAGRRLTPADRVREAPVTLVSQRMAERYWPEGDALGSRIERDRRHFEVVGIVADVRHAELREPPQPTFYVPFDVAEIPFDMTVVVRSALGAGEVAGLLRDGVRDVDSNVPVEDFAAAPAMVASAAEEERFGAGLLIAFAVTATLLSALGLFAATSRLVASRRRELGIRLALGARPGGLVRSVVREEAWPIVTGLGIGVVAAGFAARALRGLLFGVAPLDALSFAGAVAVLGLTAIGSTLLAARRGARLDPVEALRAE